MYCTKKHTSCLLAVLLLLWSCSKNGNGPTGIPNNGGSGGQNTNCVLSTISQVNSGAGAETSLSAFYNSNSEVSRLVVYDSVNKTKNFDVSFNYITPDSVSIDSYQSMRLDGTRRVVRFRTLADLADPLHADTWVFEYAYNSDGFLATKNLFINGSAKANFSTVYTYSNQQLTGCVMTSPSAGNSTVLASTLSYDNSIALKNWMYTFPDAMEGYPYQAVLNFGKHAAHPLSKVTTKLYNPATGVLLDTWTTDYGNYKTDGNGYLLSGVATGDLQQGMASFFGKTTFYYTCH